MPSRNQDPAEQFQAVDSLLTTWLAERRAVLARYTALVVASDDVPGSAAITQRQRDLCELLVDYVSAGHFEVYNELLHEAEAFGDTGAALATALIAEIADTTDVILAYEEKYGSGDQYPETMLRDLSALGELLESRFVLEDRLIAGLHTQHRRQLQSAPEEAR
ncbi:MAG: Rsd/AlgQ family anti-sigma factor [Haliea sp.]|jgi:regulator of sigma D|uniref:Rsd/AlgQ family anti-sigma factor n=1 Tax=Haliea sp. TaxID=1932666 RepID=UPI000C51932A|nr:Rsd/AlgQ family anti-sigma factor [Haliea sp.]MBM69577.1 Rsd/AlgQ family anti-sigma factor [Haliea sp.]|tara:strand:- start:39609 stop:40097 length:489 start_codon:yes stop_codon:yes gene_type:complete